MENNNYDYILVGQGLAGTLLYWYLRKAGKKVLVVDAGKSSASMAAAGIINPMTGRNYIKTWMADTVMPFAKNCYHEMEVAYGQKFYHDLPIYRALHSVKEENDWMVRLADPDYGEYAGSIQDGIALKPYLKNPVNYGVVKGAARVDLPLLIASVRKQATEENSFVNAALTTEELFEREGLWQWRDYTARSIVFCEGYHAVYNTAFNYLPFAPAKGNILLVKSDESLPFNLRDEYFVTPLGEGRYWIGSGYRWGEWDTEVNVEDIEKMLQFAHDRLAISFKEVGRLAGIRPAMRTRRPVMGEHPHQKSWYIFNGLGTKGTSLGPYFAKQMADYLTVMAPITDEVSISRYKFPSDKK
ncbi:MAG: FAD-binding oxidoreductase [Saprospiraceae bacterium]|nr:FAD-binding oxidoreductase [Saprospiraceae bacterium]